MRNYNILKKEEGFFISKYWFEDKKNHFKIWFELDEPNKHSFNLKGQEYIVCYIKGNLGKFFDPNADNIKDGLKFKYDIKPNEKIPTIYRAYNLD